MAKVLDRSDADKIRALLTQPDDPRLTFLDRIAALEQAIETLLKAIER